MVTLYRRGKVWWAEANLRSNRRRWSLKTRDRVVAEQLRRQAEIELLSPGLVPERWEDFEKEFHSAAKQDVRPKTLREYRLVLTAFSEFLKSRNVDAVADVTPALVVAFTEKRRGGVHRINRTAKTEGGIKYDLRVLHRVLAYAVECRYIDRNPVLAKNRNSVAGRTMPFAPDEVRAMLDTHYLGDKAYLRAIVLLFLYTGLRIGDVIHLTRDSIIGDSRTLKTKKRGTVVPLQLHDSVVEALRTHFLRQNAAQRKSPFVFSTETGEAIVGLDKHLRRLWKHCEIVNGHAHRFRDTFAVRLLERGASLYDVAKLLGISHQTAELHYAPYVRELQERASHLVQGLDFADRKASVAKT